MATANRENKVKSLHDTERDRIAAEWLQLPPFICAGCDQQKTFPRSPHIETEVRYEERLRADVGAIDETGRVAGVVEVVYSHPPSQQALAAQESLGFAYYRLLPLPWRNEPTTWLCSPECWVWYLGLKGRETSAPWEPRRCDECGSYFHQNRLSWFEFQDWGYDPNYAYCIHCAAAYGPGQWRSPGELAGGDPREWTPDDSSDPAELFLAYSEAAFWSMVWEQRSAKLEEPDAYEGSNHRAAEEATARRLPLVNAAFDAGQWGPGADLLLPIGAPGWADYSDEPERLLAFSSDNRRATSAAWNRLLTYRRTQLPTELVAIFEKVGK